jgi:hypothetical protein
MQARLGQVWCWSASFVLASFASVLCHADCGETVQLLTCELIALEAPEGTSDEDGRAEWARLAQASRVAGDYVRNYEAVEQVVWILTADKFGPRHVLVKENPQ